MYHVSTQGVDKRIINIHYYYYHTFSDFAGNNTLQEKCETALK